MQDPEQAVASDMVQPVVETVPAPPHHRLRRALGATGAVLTFGLLGGGAGLAIAAHNDAHVEIGGTEATVRTTGNNYNELDVDQTALTFKRYSNMEILGQPVGAKVNLNVDTSKFVKEDGSIDATLFPPYLSLFSDTKQIEHDVKWGIEKHDLWGAVPGALIGAGAYGAYRWRRKHHYDEQAAAFHGRIAAGMAAVTALCLVPSANAIATHPTVLHPDSKLAATPFKDVEIGGFLKPGINYVEHYVETYITDTNSYYDQLQRKLANYLVQNPVGIPTGDDVVSFGYVTDRHCNIGMDRVTVGLMNAYGLKTLVSGGDDDFSGSFSFESGCTSDIAERGKKAKMTLIFTLGNHDDQMTADDEKQQGIKVLNNDIVPAQGLNFSGNPDMRTSRYGQGIVPSDPEAQGVLTTAQGKRIGEIACRAGKKIIVVLHDPQAGRTALQDGCGNATVAVDGHTHNQSGPNVIPLSNDTTGYQFTGASSGGAPNQDEAQTSSPFEHLTVGPLNNKAVINIVSVNRKTGELVGVTEFTFMPDQSISVNQQLTGVSTDTKSPADSALQQFKKPNPKDVLALAAK